MATDSIGTARLDIVVDTTQLEVAIERAKTRTASMAQDAKKQYADIGAAEKRRVDSLIRQADTLGFTREQQIAYNAALRTEGPLLDDITRRLTAQRAAAQGAATQLSQYGMSAKQTAFALRGVPAQITDIFTSLQGGQNPLTVFLQQGGQLRDMFGGIVPAASALGSSIMGLVNPFTVGAAAVLGLAVAYEKGASEGRAFDQALILTGGYAGKTKEQLANLAAEFDNLAGVTTHEAASAIAAVASTGQFAGEQIELVAKAALQMQEATGRSIEETVQEFAKLRKDPVNAILDLNEKYHFLSRSQLEHIENLVEEGRQQDAVTAAFRAYSGAIDQRTPQIVENLGYIQSAWRSIKELSSEALDEMLAIGRDRTAADRIRELQSNIQGLQSGGGVYQGLSQETTRRLIGEMQAEIDALRRFEDVSARVLPGGGGSVDSSEERKRIKAEGESGRAERVGSVRAARRSSDTGRDQLTEQEKAAQALTRSFDSMNAQLERQVALFGDTTNAARVRYEIESGALKGLESDRARALEENAKWLDWLKEMAEIEKVWTQTSQEHAKERAKQSQEQLDAMSTYADEAARNMQGAFAQFLFNPFEDGLDGMLKGFAETLQRMAAEAAAAEIFQMIGQAASSYGSNNGGSFWGAIASAVGSAFTANADGAVYQSPSLHQYANQVHDTPKLFAFAKGAGVFGEAGPEAIMPLTRTAGGQLGVKAIGGGGGNITFNQTNIVNSDGSATSETTANDQQEIGKALGEQMKPLVIQVLVQQMRPGGILNKAGVKA